MKMKWLYLVFLAAVMAVGSVACAKKDAGLQSNLPAGSENANAQTEQGGMAGARAAGGKNFRGSIGDKKIEMNIRREGDQLSGTYLYRRIGSDISLKGSVDKQGNFKLQEFDNSGKQTGEFKGKWNELNNQPTIVLEGTWAKPGGSDELSFYAIEQAVELTSGLRIVAKESKEEDKKKKYWFYAEYPELTGAANPNADKFNAEAKQLVMKETQDFKQGESEMSAEDMPAGTDSNSFLEIGYDVTLAKDDLISVVFGISVYSRGAAHPNHYTRVINYDLKNGKTLKLADLFKPGSAYLETISSYSIDDLKKQAAVNEAPPDMIDEGAGPNLDNYQSWNISKKGLYITFDPYQVASYAEGPKNVIVPFASLKEIIKPDGALASIAK